MHMISKKDLNSAEMETLTTSRSPTTVITANGEVQTHEEATVYVKELDIFLTMKVIGHALSLGKLCDEHGYSCEWINGQKPHLIKNGIRIQCNTENFVPIVVLGLSTSSSSNFPSSTSMTPSRQEIDHPTPSSSSSTSTTTTVSSDSETRAREDLSGIDSHPVLVSSEHVERKERRDPFCSQIPEWLQDMNHFQSLRLREVRIWENTVFILTSLKTKLRDLSEDPKLQEPRAEDAKAKPYHVQKIYVI